MKQLSTSQNRIRCFEPYAAQMKNLWVSLHCNLSLMITSLTLTCNTETGGKESKQTEEPCPNWVFYIDTIYSSNSGSLQINKANSQEEEWWVSCRKQQETMIQTLSMTAILSCSYQPCFICGNIYVSSLDSRELLPLSTSSNVCFMNTGSIIATEFYGAAIKKNPHIPNLAQLVHFSNIQWQKIINVYGKIHLIAFTLFISVQNYLYCPYYQFFFIKIEHFPTLCSIRFF